MKLTHLTIHNFKGILDFDLNADGRDLSIYSENGVGKTTVADAYYWLLFGKDSLGRKDHEIKTVGADGEPIHYLDHAVEGVFEMSGGDTLTLSRTYREEWETQRGSSTKSFKGHKTTFTVNSVPQTLTQYQNRIANICDEAQFRLLTDPSHFINTLTWQERRKMLFDVCGDMTDQEVIDVTPELAPLKSLLGKHSLADFKKMTEAQRTATRDERSTIPARIDEATRAIPSEDSTDWSAQLTKRTSDLMQLQDERASLTAGGRSAELRSKILEIDTVRRSLEVDLRNQPNPVREAAIVARREKESLIRDAESAIDGLRDYISTAERRLSSKDVEIEARRKDAVEERARIYNGSQECPSCKRPLPEDQVQQAVEVFNAAKARRLDAMVATGKAMVAERDTLAGSLSGRRAELAEAEIQLSTLQTALAAIEVPAESTIDLSADPRIADLVDKQRAVSLELESLTRNSSHALQEVDQKIAAAQQSVAAAQTGVASSQRRIEGLARVDELKAREKELSAQWESLEHSLYLCEQFVRTKVRLLTDRINSRFRLTTFRLFREQINGGLQECCDVLWRENGALPSNGQSVQIGLDIIATLSKHIGFAPPIFVDNAESVTTLPQTDGQQICLVVSAGDREMRVERDGGLRSESLRYLAESSREPALF